MGKPRVPLDPVADLKRRLARAGNRRACVRTWWTDHDFDNCPATVGKRIAIALLTQRRPEHKLAGIAILAHHLGSELRVTDLASFAALFEDGALADAVIVDWFAAKVLGTMLARTAGRAELARQLARWRDAETTWQRRAACLAFVPLADPGLVDVALTICATVVWSPERSDQTAVGILLRALSRAAPARIAAFFRRNARFM